MQKRQGKYLYDIVDNKFNNNKNKLFGNVLSTPYPLRDLV